MRDAAPTPLVEQTARPRLAARHVERHPSGLANGACFGWFPAESPYERAVRHPWFICNGGIADAGRLRF
jgi:hypothetical protein